MKLKNLLKIFITPVFIFLSFVTIQAKAQQSAFAQQQLNPVSAGVGVGLEYGGLGANVTFYPQRNIGVFGAAGYAIAGIGYNVGAKLRLVSVKNPHRAVPYFTAMYGYNAAVAVLDNMTYSKFFYGPSFGVGVNLYSRRPRSGYWSLAVLAPVRSPDVNNYINTLKTDDNINFTQTLIPVTVSVGYMFCR